MEKSKLTLPIVIGRKYVRRDGVVVPAREQHPDIAGCAYVGGENVATPDDKEHAFIDTGRIHATAGWTNPLDLVADYVEAPALPDGFTAWGGGAQPAQTRGKRVKCIFSDGPHASANLPADDLVWAHGNPALQDIIAYKLADEQPSAEPANAPEEAAGGHPHAAKMAQYAEDAAKTRKPWLLWECHRRDLPADRPWTALVAHPEWNPSHDYRRKQRMIVVNGIEVPAGEVREPKEMERYYLANPAHSAWAHAFAWTGDRIQRELLSRGLVYLDRDACVARSKAMAATQEAA